MVGRIRSLHPGDMDCGTIFATVFDTILNPVTLRAATIVGRVSGLGRPGCAFP